MRHILMTAALSFGLAAAAFASQSTQAQLQKEAKISMKEARATALKKVPNGRIESAELEREHGKLIYSFDIHTAKGTTEVNVDAIDGKVIASSHETKAQEAAEKKAEKKAEKH